MKFRVSQIVVAEVGQERLTHLVKIYQRNVKLGNFEDVKSFWRQYILSNSRRDFHQVNKLFYVRNSQILSPNDLIKYLQRLCGMVLLDRIQSNFQFNFSTFFSVF